MLNDNWGDGNRSDMVGLARPRGLIYMVLSRGKAHVADAFALRLSITLTFIRALSSTARKGPPPMTPHSHSSVHSSRSHELTQECHGGVMVQG